jgi:deoxyribose-phosphate aldolase
MELNEILRHVDHTLLRQEATWEEIRTLCDEGLRYHTASVCIPPSYVRQAADYLKGQLPVCTVIGFPNGYSTTKTKLFEAADAVENGADELDVVINLGLVKDKRWDDLMVELQALRGVCSGKCMKVIVETCLLTQEEKIKLCEVVSGSGADYIKTSTGFSTGGATREDIALMAEHVAAGVKIKAAGGISSLEDAEEFLTLGADRLGTSRLVRLAENFRHNGVVKP